jgi:sensor histidine kinase YesM
MDINIANTIYATDIFKWAESKTDTVFYNSSAEHAAIVHHALVKYSEKYIDIFSSSMCSEISNNSDYCQLIKTFLDRDNTHKINIIFTDYDEDFVQTNIASLLAKYPFQVTIKRYDGQVMYKDRPVHFTVADDRAFRLETDIEKHMAFGNFNSVNQAKALKDTFDKIFQSKLVQNIPLC